MGWRDSDNNDGGNAEADERFGVEISIAYNYLIRTVLLLFQEYSKYIGSENGDGLIILFLQMCVCVCVCVCARAHNHITSSLKMHLSFREFPTDRQAGNSMKPSQLGFWRSKVQKRLRKSPRTPLPPPPPERKRNCYQKWKKKTPKNLQST